MSNHALIFAGGKGSRMEDSSVPKQFLCIEEVPIIIHTIEAFEHHPEIDAIVVVCLKDWIPYLESLLEKYSIKKVCSIVPGGHNGQESIYKGLVALGRFACSSDIILVNDGVRPNISSDLISRNIESVMEYGSAISSSPVIETVLNIENGLVLSVCDRRIQRHAKAPQSFFYGELIAAHERAISEGLDDFIDCCTMMNHYGHDLHLVDSSPNNIKVTTMKDYFLLQEMWKRRMNDD